MPSGLGISDQRKPERLLPRFPNRRPGPRHDLTNLTKHGRDARINTDRENMRKAVNIYQAKSQLSDLVSRAADGEEFVIAKSGKPRARLVPLAVPPVRRRPGGGKGKVWVADDFDAPLPADLLAAFEGR